MPPVPADPRDVEIQRLRAALAEALAGLVATRAELVALREQAKVSEQRIAELTAQVGRLTEVVAAGNDRIAELAAAANRKRKAATPPTPKPPPTSATVAPEDRPRPPVIPPKVKPGFSIAILRTPGRMNRTSWFNDFQTIGWRSIGGSNGFAATGVMRFQCQSSWQRMAA